jgi:ankyrin repeat protein
LFRHISTAANLSQLEDLISSLPSSLDDAYEDILSKIPKGQANDAARILRILCLSSRPLTVNELSHALAVDLGQKPCLNIEGRVFRLNEIHFMLGCLVEFAYEKGLATQECITIQIAHLSVREYLQSDKIRQQSTVSIFAIEHSSTHMEIAQTCLLYLLEPKISQREHTQDKLMDFPFASYAAKEWLYHYTRSDTPSSIVQKLVVELFKDQGGCFNTWIELRDMGCSWRATDFTDATDSRTTPLYHACLLGLTEIAAELVTFYDVNAPGGRYGNALQAAVSQSHIDVVCNLLDGSPGVDSDKESLSTEQANLSERQVTEIQTLPKTNTSIDVNARGGEYGTSLIAASYNGNRELVLMLLCKGSNINDQVGQYGNALAAASLRGHKTVVQELLKAKADFNASTSSGRYGNALIAASSAGHSEIVQTLLSLDKNAINYSRSEMFGNPFHAASFGGHTNVLRDLLKSGADINAEDDIFGTALGSACFRGHMSAVQILIDYGAEVNTSSGRFGSALQAASLGGHTNLVRYLLDKGAKVNASGGRFGNALQAASFGTHDSISQCLQQAVRNMLLRGVQILPQIRNALQVASLDAYRWDEETLKELSKKVLSYLPNASSAMSSEQRDPFLDASFIDRGPLVQLLLENGADVNAAGGEYGSALQAASSQGLETVVEILLRANADVQASGGIHGSALELASNQNHEGIMKMLQKANRDLLPNASSY